MTFTMQQPPQETIIDHEHHLYRRPSALGGVYTVSFETMDMDIRCISEFLRERGHDVCDAVPPSGTLEHVALFDTLWRELIAHNLVTNEVCTARLEPELIGMEGCLIEVKDKHRNTRQFVLVRTEGPMPHHSEYRKLSNGRTRFVPMGDYDFRTANVLRENVVPSNTTG